MHPVLFKFGNLTVHTYGFFIAIGVLSGIFLQSMKPGGWGWMMRRLLMYVFIRLSQQSSARGCFI